MNNKEPPPNLKKSVMIDEFFLEVNEGVWREDTPIGMSQNVLKYLYGSEDWVHICVDLLSLECSNAKAVVKKRVQGEGQKDAWLVDDTHPLNTLLNSPHPLVPKTAFTHRMACEYFLGGNFLAWKTKLQGEVVLIPLCFECVQLEFKDGNLVSYLWTDPESTGSKKPVQLRIPVAQVLHVRKSNPYSIYWGLSPFLAGKSSVMFNKLTAEYMNNFYLRGAAPQMILETETSVNADQLMRMVKVFENSYSGRKNLRRTLALPKGVTAKPFNISAADQRLIELVKMNRETILNLLHIPKHAVTLQEAGSLGSEEMKATLQYLWNSNIIPNLKVFAETQTTFYRDDLGEDHIIDYDLSSVMVLKEDLLKKAQLAKEMLQTLTLNEVRSAVWEKDPIEGGDIVVSLRPTPGVPNNLQPVTPSKPPSTGSTTPTAQGGGGGEPSAALPVEMEMADYGEWYERHKADLEPRFKTVEGEIDRAKGEMDNVSTKTLTGMMARSLQQLAKFKGLKEEIDETKLRKRIENSYAEMEDDFEVDYVGTLTSTVEMGNELGLSFIFDPVDRDAATALSSKDEKGRRNTLKARGLSTFSSVSETTTDAVMEVVAKGVEEGKPVDKIAQDIVSAFEDFTPARAETIAQTETLTAMSIGQASAMKAAVTVNPKLKKVWVSAGDNRVRGNPGGKNPNTKSDHFHMHGQVRDAEVPFQDPRSKSHLDYPRDPKHGKASDVIRCRCTWVTAAPEDLRTIIQAIGGLEA